jgi:hypothetical protein
LKTSRRGVFLRAGGFSGSPGAVRRCSGVGGRGDDCYECDETGGVNPGSELSHNARSARGARAGFFPLAPKMPVAKEQPGDDQKRKIFQNIQCSRARGTLATSKPSFKKLNFFWVKISFHLLKKIFIILGKIPPRSAGLGQKSAKTRENTGLNPV